MLEAICTFQYEIFAGNRRESGGTGGSHTSNSWTCRRQLLRHHLRTEVNICWFFLKWKFLSVDGETVRPTRQAPLSWNWWLAGERWHFHFFIICYGSALRTIRSPRAEGLIYSNLNWNASGDWGNLWTRIPTSGHDGHAQREIWAEGKFSHFPDFNLSYFNLINFNLSYHLMPNSNLHYYVAGEKLLCLQWQKQFSATSQRQRVRAVLTAYNLVNRNENWIKPRNNCRCPERSVLSQFVSESLGVSTATLYSMFRFPDSNTVHLQVILMSLKSID